MVTRSVVRIAQHVMDRVLYRARLIAVILALQALHTIGVQLMGVARQEVHITHNLIAICLEIQN